MTWDDKNEIGRVGDFDIPKKRAKWHIIEKSTIWIPWVILAVMMMIVMLVGGCADIALASECESSITTGLASWFSNIETRGKNCADGKYHDLASEYVIASWRYPLGTIVSVSTLDNHSVICKVVDRGPGRKDGTSRYYKGTRIADLSKKVFETLSSSGTTKEGLIIVSVEKVK